MPLFPKIVLLICSPMPLPRSMMNCKWPADNRVQSRNSWDGQEQSRDWKLGALQGCSANDFKDHVTPLSNDIVIWTGGKKSVTGRSGSFHTGRFSCSWLISMLAVENRLIWGELKGKLSSLESFSDIWECIPFFLTSSWKGLRMIRGWKGNLC